MGIFGCLFGCDWEQLHKCPIHGKVTSSGAFRKTVTHEVDGYAQLLRCSCCGEELGQEIVYTGCRKHVNDVDADYYRMKYMADEKGETDGPADEKAV